MKWVRKRTGQEDELISRENRTRRWANFERARDKNDKLSAQESRTRLTGQAELSAQENWTNKKKKKKDAQENRTRRWTRYATEQDKKVSWERNRTGQKGELRTQGTNGTGTWNSLRDQDKTKDLSQPATEARTIRNQRSFRALFPYIAVPFWYQR